MNHARGSPWLFQSYGFLQRSKTIYSFLGAQRGGTGKQIKSNLNLKSLPQPESSGMFSLPCKKRGVLRQNVQKFLLSLTYGQHHRSLHSTDQTQKSHIPHTTRTPRNRELRTRPNPYTPRLSPQCDDPLSRASGVTLQAPITNGRPLTCR